MRTVPWLPLAFVLVVSACGGSGHSPSEPAPPPPTPTPEPVALEGSWSGTVTIMTSPGASCTMTVQLTRDGQDFLGNWSSRCSDGKQGNGIAFANTLPFSQALIAGVGGPGVFGGCGWASVAIRQGSRLHGDWANADNCASGTLRGQLELTKQ